MEGQVSRLVQKQSPARTARTVVETTKVYNSLLCQLWKPNVFVYSGSWQCLVIGCSRAAHLARLFTNLYHTYNHILSDMALLCKDT